jgi:hypothetical protein
MQKDAIDNDDLIRLRGLIYSLTYFLEDVLRDGVPKPPPPRASADAQSADQEWHECRWQLVNEANQFLEETGDWV